LTIHQCPKCELRFGHRTELDDHCWHDHPEFRHDYPAVVVVPPEAEPVPAQSSPEPHHEHIPFSESLLRWVVPGKRHD
jgi:hypothetical protein